MTLLHSFRRICLQGKPDRGLLSIQPRNGTGVPPLANCCGGTLLNFLSLHRLFAVHQHPPAGLSFAIFGLAPEHESRFQRIFRDPARFDAADLPVLRIDEQRVELSRSRKYFRVGDFL
ncbi:MAG: hypothetical protein KGZ73_07170 [Rhizobiales bacterium]|nr:hypothetical protein [Hyphomicrobiales bacterium]